MNAIFAAYTASSDCEDELNKDESMHANIACHVQNSEPQQTNHSPDGHVGNVKQPAPLSKHYLSQSLQYQNIPVFSTSDHDPLLATAETENEAVINNVRTIGGIQLLKSESNKTILCTPVIKKDTVMPYISKAKRRKIASELNTDAESSSNSSNMFSSVFKKERIFSKESTWHCYAPKRRLVHFDAHQGCINSISWNPCFQDILLSASMDCVVKVWNVDTTPSCVEQVNVHTEAVKDAKWSIDGLKVLSGGYDKFARITDINIGKEICANKHNSFVTCVLYHPSDPCVYLSGTSDDGIFAWDVRTKQYISRYKSFFGQVQDLEFLPDEQCFISAAEISRRNSTDKGIMVWDYKTTTILSNQVFQEVYTCSALQIHPNDSTFLVQCNADYIAVFSQKYPYKLNKYKRFEGHRVSGYHIGLDISRDGSLVASGSSDGLLYVYNYRTSNVIKTLTLDSQPCMDVAWSPSDPSLLASANWNGRIFLHK